VVFTEEGYDSVTSTIEGLPDINPMGTNPAPPPAP